MSTLFDEYLLTIEKEGTLKPLKSERISKLLRNFDLIKCSRNDIIIVFHMFALHSEQNAKNMLSMLRGFARYVKEQTGNAHFLNILSGVDSKDVFSKGENEKYINEDDFWQAFFALDNPENYNCQYVQAMFLGIYEGIYSGDFSALANLRASDIISENNRNVVIVRPNKSDAYTVAISDRLKELLLELSRIDTWISDGKGREYTKERTLEGIYPDSCFKFDVREYSNRKSPVETIYYNVFGNWNRVYIQPEIGFKIEPRNIYFSGILNRIAKELHSRNITLTKGFEIYPSNVEIKRTMENVMRECGYKRKLKDFKPTVKDYLDIFDVDYIYNKADEVKIVIPSQERLYGETVQDVLACVDKDEESLENEEVLHGVPIAKKELVCKAGHYFYPRDRKKASYALRAAKHKCEVNPEHETFMSRSKKVPYTESHHLIPLAYSDSYKISLDVVENIVSLCSHCHNLLHYGIDAERVLYTLYEQRKFCLAEAGIFITFEDLLRMYGLR